MKLILSKKIITVLSILVIIAISTKIAFAVWDGNPYSPGATNDPECLPSQTNCDVYPAVITEADPLALRLNQSTPQTFTAGAVTGSGILKVTGGILGLDTNTYLTTYSETDPIFIASSAFGISGTNISNWNTAFGWGNHATAGYLTSLSGALLATGATTGATSQAQQFTLGITSPGTITFSGFTSNGGPLFTNGSGVVAQATAGTSSQVLHGGTSPSFSSVSLASDISGMLGVGNGGTGANSLNDLITLGTHTTGNYVATLTSGSGISSTATGESSTPTISLSALTADWNQTGAFNISLNNSSSGLKILENGATPTLFGIFDVADLTSSDKTYTFPNATGTILTTGNISDITGLADSQISDTLTASIFKGSGTSTDAVDLGTAEVSGTLGVGNGGTGTATAFTAGSVAFAGSSGIYTQDNTSLFFDDTNNRLGILDSTPSAALTVGSGDLFQVNSSGAIAATTGYTQGSGTMSLTSANTTQLTTSSAFTGNFNSLTTGTGMYLASSTLSSGKLVDLQVNSTASSSTGQTGLNILLTGANGTASQTTYGLRVSNTHTGTTPINWSAYFDERVNVGAGNQDANHALIVRSVDNTANHGIKILAGNQTTYMELGYNTISGPGGLVLSPGTSTGLSIQGSGVMYVGGAVAPTARVHIAAGTTSASSAPLKFTSGTNMTVAEAGAVEYDGTALTYTNSTPTRIRLLGNNYGIAGGTTLIGGTGTTDTLTLRSTSGTGAAGADIIFQTGTNGGTEAMRILNSGNVGIQQNNPGFALHVGSSSITDGTTLIRLQDTNSTCDFNANAGAPSCGSDATLKKDITSLDTTDLLNKVSALNPVSYRWLTQDRSESPQYGFIAQEVESQFPDLVSPHTWIDGTTKKFLNTGGLMPYTVGAIKELDIKVKGLSSLDTTNNNSTGSLIKRFLADIGNGIEDLYARVIHSDRVETKTLCVGSTCVTEEQFLKMVQQNGAQNNNGNNGAGDVIPPPVLDPAPTPDSMPTPETPPELSPVDIQTPEQTP